MSGTPNVLPVKVLGVLFVLISVFDVIHEINERFLCQKVNLDEYPSWLRNYDTSEKISKTLITRSTEFIVRRSLTKNPKKKKKTFRYTTRYKPS